MIYNRCIFIFLFLFLGCKVLFPTRAPSDTQTVPTQVSDSGAGKLSIISKPWSWVWINNHPINKKTPLINYHLAPGSYDLCLRTEDNREYCTQVHIVANQTVRVEYEFASISDLCQRGELPHRVTFYVKHGNSRVVANTAETQASTDDILNLVRQFLTILKQQDFVSLKSLFNSQVRIRVKILSIDPPDFDDFTVTPRNIRSAAIHNHFVGLISDQGFSEAVSEFCHGVRQPRYPEEEMVSEEIIANRELNRFEYILRYPACGDINTITIKIRKTSSSLKIFGASFIIGWIGCGEDD